MTAPERHFSTILDNMESLVWVADSEDRITYANRRFREVFGPTDSMVALSASPLLEPLRSLTHGVRKDGRGRTLSHRLRMQGRWRDLESMVFPLTAAGEVSAVCVVCSDVTDTRRSERSLHRTELRARRLAIQLLTTQDEERRRLARELHDDISQQLASLSIYLGILRSRLPEDRDAIVEEIRRLESMAIEIAESLRGLSRRLHPAGLRMLGLGPALNALCSEVQRRWPGAVDCDFGEPVPRLPAEAEVGVYRIAQEALNNAVRHSGSDRITVRLMTTEEGLVMEVRDDGQGFSKGDLGPSEGLGLLSMRERAELLGGELSIQAGPGAGTKILFRLPLEREG